MLTGPSAGLPRVYDLGLETISHGDGRVDTEGLGSFIAAYQTVTDLKLGELWAVPIMLRIALIENLRRVGRPDRRRQDRPQPGRLLGGSDDGDRRAGPEEPDSGDRRHGAVESADGELVCGGTGRRLQGQGPDLALPLTWIEQRLAECGWTSKELVQSENQQQAADQVSMSNSIGSLRFLGAMDWRGFRRDTERGRADLASGPGGVYSKMDFSTRDRYRHVVEEIAKNCRHSESQVAREAIQLALRARPGKAAATARPMSAFT